MALAVKLAKVVVEGGTIDQELQQEIDAFDKKRADATRTQSSL